MEATSLRNGTWMKPWMQLDVQGRSWKYALGSKSGGNVAEEWNLDETMDAAGCTGKKLEIRSGIKGGGNVAEEWNLDDRVEARSQRNGILDHVY